MSRITLSDQYCAPAPTEERGLLVVQSPLLRILGEHFALSRELIIGRDPSCDFVLDMHDVSRRHARIHERHGRHLVADLGSTNGTFVDERRITRSELTPGSLLRVGSVILKYLPRSDPQATCCTKLKRLADEDTLTGLALRRVFSDALERELARSRRYGHPLCLALLDIDRFKDVNDRFGHLVGDAVLLQVASAISALVRREQLLARMGGDELALLLPDVPLPNALAFASKIRQLVEGQAFGTRERMVQVTISIGVAELGENDLEPDGLLARADAHLYAAKCAGRNQVFPPVGDSRELAISRNGVEVTRKIAASLRAPGRAARASVSTIMGARRGS